MPSLLAYTLLFTGISAFFIFSHLMLGRLVRPSRPDAEKKTIYECGEPTIGTSWIQFDLRFYVVALLFVIFDVEMAFFFPWAVVFGKANELSDRNLAPERQAQVISELGPVGFDSEGARLFAITAFVDILVFFGVLLVGFAYLWHRGDLDWVRSLEAERADFPQEEPPAPKEKESEMVPTAV
jgi:NADH-quinone oxidoreductase subunit A